jgi:hypothetical protein
MSQGNVPAAIEPALPPLGDAPLLEPPLPEPPLVEPPLLLPAPPGRGPAS